MSTVAIIQARMGSTRLPGKILMDIHGRSMLERVIMRADRAHLVDEVVVATTKNNADSAVVDLCHDLGIRCPRGNEQDVLDRYHNAAQECGAETIVRITSDCPLIDPVVIDRVVDEYHRVRPDYASNIFERNYPRGLDTEVFRASTLATAWREATAESDRIHVTPFIWRHPDRFRIHSVAGGGDCSDLRWTVDTQLDLDVVRDIFHIAGDDFVAWETVLDIVRADPDHLTRNRIIEQKKLEEG